MESDAACSHAPIRPSTVRQSRADAGLLKQPAGLTHVSVCCRCIECSADSHASLICQRCCTCTVLPRTLSTTPGANRTNISSRAGGCCSLMSGLSSPTAAHLLLPTRERPRMRCLSSKTPFAVTELAPRAYHSEITATHSRFQLCGAYAFARVAAKERPPRRRNRVSGFGKSWGVLCLSSSTTLKAGSVAPQATIRRSAAEEEKCRLTLPATCDTAHPKRQNAAERGRALIGAEREQNASVTDVVS